MSFEFNRLDEPEIMSGNASDSDYYSEFNSNRTTAKSNRGGQRSSSLPEHKVQNVSDSLSMETILASNQLTFQEIENVMKVGRDHNIVYGIN